MGTYIDIRLWLKDNTFSIGERLADIVDCVETWDKIREGWMSIAVNDSNSYLGRGKAVTFKREKKMALREVLKHYNEEKYHFTVNFDYECWRFDNLKETLGSLPLRLEISGHEFTTWSRHTRKIDGDAHLWISSCAPYVALLRNFDNPDVTKRNGFAEQNLEDLTEIIFALSHNNNTSTIKIFTDSGAYIPCNAHLAFYSHKRDVINDIAILSNIWTNGDKVKKMQPFCQLNPNKMSWELHEWRTEANRIQLYQRMKQNLEEPITIKEADIKEILNSGTFEFYNKKTGFVVLDFPHYPTRRSRNQEEHSSTSAGFCDQ